MKNTSEFLDKFRRARSAGTPLFAVTTFNPEATMASIQRSIAGAVDDKDNEGVPPTPIIQWDIIDGWRGRNKAGIEAILRALEGVDSDQTINPTESLKCALKLPERTILFLLNAQHYLERPDFLQAVWNLRDPFKSDQQSVVMLGPDFTLPAQLQNDIFVLDEPLPTEPELREIITDVVESVAVKISKQTESDAVDALRGLSAFPAEQSVAMNLTKKGLDVEGLWERKRRLISSTPGLKVYDGVEKFADIGGCDQIKKFMSGVIKGREAPNVIVFIDEGEKMFAGSSGAVNDSSGVSQDYLATTLSYMEDNDCDGAILIGPPGAAKSAMAKATGNEARIPTVMLDLGGMKGGLVGKSEAQLRNAYKIITAVGGGKAFFILTCNQISALPPELRRRFTSGIFFFDLPSKKERESIWPIYLKKYNLKFDTDFDDSGWTGAEIRNCCRLAYRQRLSLLEASRYIVPVSRSASQLIQSLRRQADGSYLSANDEGVYRWDDPDDPLSAQTLEKVKKRKIDIS